MSEIKKVLKILLIATILLCAFISAPYVTAVSQPRIVVSSVEANAGDTVDINISLEDNPGIVSATLTVYYDKDTLTLTDVTDAELLGSSMHKPEYSSPYTLAWTNDLAAENFTVNGVIATLRFKISANAKSGASLPVELSYNYDEYDIYNAALEPVRFEVESGTISVTGSSAPSTSEQSGETSDMNNSESSEAAPTVRSIRGCVIKGVKNKTYTGKAQTQKITVKDGTKTLKKGADYLVSYSNNKNAGTAKMMVKGKGSYNGKVTKSFKIAKAKNPVVVTVKKKTVSYRKLRNKTITLKKIVAYRNNQGKVTCRKVKGNKKITVDSKGVFKLKKGLKKGSYSIRIQLTAKGNKNYYSKAVVKTLSVTVK